ncbi:MAG: type II toxin-antitoxin system HicB family antitoxin [Candidatus Solibacter sp.]
MRTRQREGRFRRHVPRFPWGVTQGDTEEEAVEMATDAIALVINELIKRGEEVPRQTKLRGRKYRIIRLPALQAAKTGLYRTFSASGIRKSEVARRLNIPKTVVDRLFDLSHNSRLDQIEAAFRALAKRLTVQVEEAA